MFLSAARMLLIAKARSNKHQSGCKSFQLRDQPQSLIPMCHENGRGLDLFVGKLSFRSHVGDFLSKLGDLIGEPFVFWFGRQ